MLAVPWSVCGGVGVLPRRPAGVLHTHQTLADGAAAAEPLPAWLLATRLCTPASARSSPSRCVSFSNEEVPL